MPFCLWQTVCQAIIMCDCFILLQNETCTGSLQHSAPLQEVGRASVGNILEYLYHQYLAILSLTNCKSSFYECLFYIITERNVHWSLPHSQRTAPRRGVGISGKEILDYLTQGSNWPFCL